MESGLQPASLVSIVIVAHNNWPDLELALQSALNQSYRAIEVIVIDNGSADATAQRVPALFGERVRYVRQANTGEGGGRNAGFGLAKGDFIQFLDGDDLLAPDKVERQSAVFESNADVDIVYGDVRRFQSMAGAASWVDWDTRDYDDMLATLLSRDGNGGGLLPDSVLFRRGALERVGAWMEDAPGADGTVQRYSGSDQDYWLRAAWSGCRFKYCPGSLCFYRKHAAQLNADRGAMVRGMEPALTRAYQYITREPYRTAVSRRLSQLLLYLAVADREGGVETSLARLRRARAVSEEVVTRSALAMATLLVITRSGPFVFGDWLRPVRRMFTKLAGMKGYDGLR